MSARKSALTAAPFVACRAAWTPQSVQRAIGDRLTCVFVDHGLLRAGEREQVEKDFVASTGAKLITAHEADAFLSKLAGVTDPEAKRKAIGAEFIRSFERAVAQALEESPEDSTVDFLVQGTLGRASCRER